MLAFVFLPLILAILIFIYLRSRKYIFLNKSIATKVVEIIFGLLLFGGLLCVLIGFLLPNGFVLKRQFTKAGYYWFGLILYFFVSLIIALICRLIIWLFTRNNGYNVDLARKLTAFFVIIFTTIMSVYGIENAHKLRVTNYEVNVDKVSKLDELNIALVADLHLGYNVGVEEIKDMVDKVNDMNPDILIVAGDIFDNEYDAIDNPTEIIKLLNSIKTKYGKYATYGNHDIEEKILMGFTFNVSKNTKAKAQADERMNKFVKDAGFTFLYDNYELIDDDIYIYGRPDANKINFGKETRVPALKVTDGLDKTKTIICVNHEPDELQELAAAGVDLDLSGHTHNGQIWPGTLTINLFWDNAYGLKQINNMSSIVTSGVGLFGLNMRTGCHPEVVNIKLQFKK